MSPWLEVAGQGIFDPENPNHRVACRERKRLLSSFDDFGGSIKLYPMKARSAGLKIRRTRPAEKGESTRLPRAERREKILDQAADFFAEYGLTGQTRSLAATCGVSQRLLYRFFPTKAALLAEVYARAILGPFKGDWLTQLADRSRTMEERLVEFYSDYSRIVLTRRWLRLFLYSSLADEHMAQDYISSIITRLMETIVAETAAEQGVAVPDNPALVHELGWTLHGNVSHLAIRRHLYHASGQVAEDDVIRIHVRGFLVGFKAMSEAVQQTLAAR